MEFLMAAVLRVNIPLADNLHVTVVINYFSFLICHVYVGFPCMSQVFDEIC